MSLFRRSPLFLFLVSCAIMAAQSAHTAGARVRGPVIDMHMHAEPADAYGPPPLAMCTPFVMPAWDPKQPYEQVFLDLFKHPQCANPVWSPLTNDAVMRDSIAAMQTSHVVLGVLSGSPEMVATWKKAAPPSLFLQGIGLRIGRNYTPDQLRKLHAEGKLDILAELTNEYEGMLPSDPAMEPYWALAEELDIPVGIHLGPGPPGIAYLDSPHMRARMSSAFTMEEVLVKHPKLRVYLMHAGFPLIDDLLAVLYNHPQVYVDVGVIVYTQPPASFYSYVRQITDAGFGKRILFGSDQMVWPGTIERSIRVIEADPYLTEAQKRDVFYNNAVRFLRLSPRP